MGSLFWSGFFFQPCGAASLIRRLVSTGLKKKKPQGSCNNFDLPVWYRRYWSVIRDEKNLEKKALWRLRCPYIFDVDKRFKGNWWGVRFWRCCKNDSKSILFKGIPSFMVVPAKLLHLRCNDLNKFTLFSFYFHSLFTLSFTKHYLRPKRLRDYLLVIENLTYRVAPHRFHYTLTLKM